MILEARNLTRAVLLRGQEQVLVRDVTFRVASGEVLGITGPSGSGKSALLRLVAGLDPKSCGDVALDGRPIAPDLLPWLRRNVILVPRDVPALAGCPIDTWTEAREFALRDDVIPTVDPASAARALGIDLGKLERPWSGLAPPEARIAFLAVALALEPGFLLLDEITEGLPPDSRRAVSHGLKRLDPHTGVVVASKDEVFLAGVARHLLVLYDGEVHAEGPPEAVIPAACARARGEERN